MTEEEKKDERFQMNAAEMEVTSSPNRKGIKYNVLTGEITEYELPKEKKEK